MLQECLLNYFFRTVRWLNVYEASVASEDPPGDLVYSHR